MSGRRILHITTFLQGGAGRIVADLACAQRAAGWRPVVACAADAAGGYQHYDAWLEQLASHDVPLVPVACTFRRSDEHQRRAVETLTRAADVARGVDVIHAHAAIPALVGMQLPHRAPLLVTMHGWNASKAPEHAAADVDVFNRVPFVVVPSRAAAAHLREAGVEAHRLRVVPYGVEPQPVGTLTAADLAMVERWRGEGRLVLVCIGSVGARKRQRLVLEALAHPACRGRFACAFVGEGEELGAHVDVARTLGLAGTVEFLGYRRHTGPCLAVADLAVFASAREGMPIALLEAAAHRVVPVVSDIPEHLEFVGDCADELAFDGTALHLAERLSALADDPATCQALTARLARRWADGYKPDRMIEAYEGLYRDAGMRRLPTGPTR